MLEVYERETRFGFRLKQFFIGVGSTPPVEDLSEGTTRTVTVEIIVGAIVLIVSTIVFLNVGTDLKVYLTVFLGVVGFLNFLALIQFWRKFGWKLTQWQRRISKRPDLIDELLRLDGQIFTVLYERATGHPSLALEGAECMQALANALGDKSLQKEFDEKLAMASQVYRDFHQEIGEKPRGYPWKTLEFVETLRKISGHFSIANLIFPTVYRQTETWPKNKPFPEGVRTKWKDFVTEYNLVLNDWKKFTGQVDKSIGYGTGPQVGLAKELP